MIPDSPHESDTTRDGLLSTTTEVHAFVIGLGVGAASAVLAVPEIAAVFILSAVWAGTLVVFGLLNRVPKVNATVAREIKQEPWYAVAGTLLGYALWFVQTLR